jgi:histidinol dehydrogenase
MAPAFTAAVESAARIRDALAPGAALVLITNGTGLLKGETFDFLRRFAVDRGLCIWLKLDAGTDGWYRLINRAAFPFEKIVGKMRDFVRAAPVIIQTMLCSVNGSPPPDSEAAAWEKLALELAGAVPAAGESAGSGVPRGVRGFQIYGKARPAPGDPLAEALPLSFLEDRAASLRNALARMGTYIPVEVYN